MLVLFGASDAMVTRASIRMVAGGSSSDPRYPMWTYEESLVRNFLGQRAIQTQLHIHNDMSNECHKNWLMGFAEDAGCAQLCAGTEMLHCHTALSAPWDDFILSLMEAPDVTQEVEIAGAFSNRAGSGGAPPPAPASRPAPPPHLRPLARCPTHRSPGVKFTHGDLPSQVRGWRRARRRRRRPRMRRRPRRRGWRASRGPHRPSTARLAW